MNNGAAKAAKEQFGAAPHVVDLRDRVPQMSDDALATLLGNARRLIGAGTQVQQRSAADLIPVLETEWAARDAVKADAAAAKKVAAAKTAAARAAATREKATKAPATKTPVAKRPAAAKQIAPANG